MVEGAKQTVKALREEGVEVIEIPYDEVMKYGGGIRCCTRQLIRDPNLNCLNNKITCLEGGLIYASFKAF